MYKERGWKKKKRKTQAELTKVEEINLCCVSTLYCSALEPLAGDLHCQWLYSSVCYPRAINSMQGNPLTHPSNITQQLWLPVSPRLPTLLLPQWTAHRKAHVNQSLINLNGVNECQSECEWVSSALIGMASHIYTANHLLSDCETNRHAHSIALIVDFSVRSYDTWWLTKWPQYYLSHRALH